MTVLQTKMLSSAKSYIEGSKNAVSYFKLARTLYSVSCKGLLY